MCEYDFTDFISYGEKIAKDARYEKCGKML